MTHLRQILHLVFGRLSLLLAVGETVILLTTPLSIPIETSTKKGEGGGSRMAVSPTASSASSAVGSASGSAGASPAAPRPHGSHGQVSDRCPCRGHSLSDAALCWKAVAKLTQQSVLVGRRRRRRTVCLGFDNRRRDRLCELADEEQPVDCRLVNHAHGVVDEEGGKQDAEREYLRIVRLVLCKSGDASAE